MLRLSSNTTTAVSLTPDGKLSSGGAINLAYSPDGHSLAYLSSADDLTATGGRAFARPAPDPLRSLESVERDHVLQVLAACGGNREETSRVLGISRRTLSRMIQRWNLPRRLT